MTSALARRPPRNKAMSNQRFFTATSSKSYAFGWSTIQLVQSIYPSGAQLCATPGLRLNERRATFSQNRPYHFNHASLRMKQTILGLTFALTVATTIGAT